MIEVAQLQKNMIDQVKEAQLKLGYVKEMIRLYYPLDSFFHLIKTTEITKSEELKDFLKELENDFFNKYPQLGKIQFNVSRGRVEACILPEGVEYINNEIKTSEFLIELISLFQNKPKCSLSEIKNIFYHYSSRVICEKTEKLQDFDYMLHFEDLNIDSYFYCIKFENHHTIYHRFLKDDYEKLFSSI